VSTSHWDSATFRVDVGNPDAPATRILQGEHAVTDWKPAADDPAPRFVDRTPPAAFFLPSPDAAGASAASARTLSRRSLGLVVADATGIRRIRLAVARKVRRRGATLCRFAGRTGLGSQRRCDRPRYIRGSSEQELLAALKLLRRGRYLAGFVTADVRGNRTARLRLRPVELR
jgi:hypothetical protein